MSIFNEPLWTKEFHSARYSFSVNVGDHKVADVDVIFGRDEIIAEAKYEGVRIEKPYPKMPPKPDYDQALDLCQVVAKKVGLRLQTTEAMNEPL